MRLIIVVLYSIITLIKTQVYISNPPALNDFYKKQTGKDYISLNYANFGRIPYGYITVNKSL